MSDLSSVTCSLPLPRFELRQLVGPTEDSDFDNSSGELVFPELPVEAYEAVFDFGCGCGRQARQLMQQVPRPRRYLGIDVHRGMIAWCQANLAPWASGFEFIHADVADASFNPGPDKPRFLPFPVEPRSFSLVNAWSVFTHLLEDQVVYYLDEVRRVLRDDGIFQSTWFLFDKTLFPMMQAFQNALFINPLDLGSAVIFDRTWLRDKTRTAGLTIFRAVPPEIRGFQWVLWMAPVERGLSEEAFSEDLAEPGILRAPTVPSPADL